MSYDDDFDEDFERYEEALGLTADDHGDKDKEDKDKVKDEDKEKDKDPDEDFTIVIDSSAQTRVRTKSKVMPSTYLGGGGGGAPSNIRAILKVRPFLEGEIIGGPKFGTSGTSSDNYPPVPLRCARGVDTGSTLVRIALPEQGQFVHYKLDGCIWECQPRDPNFGGPSSGNATQRTSYEALGRPLFHALTSGKIPGSPELAPDDIVNGNASLLMYGGHGTGKSYSLFGLLANPPKPPAVPPPAPVFDKNHPNYYSELNRRKRMRMEALSNGGAADAKPAAPTKNGAKAAEPTGVASAKEWLGEEESQRIADKDGIVIRLIADLLKFSAGLSSPHEEHRLDIFVSFLRLFQDQLFDLNEPDPSKRVTTQLFYQNSTTTTSPSNGGGLAGNPLRLDDRTAHSYYSLKGVKPVKVSSIAEAKDAIMKARQTFLYTLPPLASLLKKEEKMPANQPPPNTGARGCLIVVVYLVPVGKMKEKRSLQKLMIVDLPDSTNSAADLSATSAMLALGASLNDSVKLGRLGFPFPGDLITNASAEEGGRPNKGPFFPVTHFRNSTLTRALKECMYGQRTMTYIVGCVSPSPSISATGATSNIALIHNTIRFLQQVKNQSFVTDSNPKLIAQSVHSNTVVGGSLPGPSGDLDRFVLVRAEEKLKVNAYLGSSGVVLNESAALMNIELLLNLVVGEEIALPEKKAAANIASAVAVVKNHTAAKAAQFFRYLEKKLASDEQADRSAIIERSVQEYGNLMKLEVQRRLVIRRHGAVARSSVRSPGQSPTPGPGDGSSARGRVDKDEGLFAMAAAAHDARVEDSLNNDFESSLRPEVESMVRRVAASTLPYHSKKRVTHRSPEASPAREHPHKKYGFFKNENIDEEWNLSNMNYLYKNSMQKARTEQRITPTVTPPRGAKSEQRLTSRVTPDPHSESSTPTLPKRADGTKSPTQQPMKQAPSPTSTAPSNKPTPTPPPVESAPTLPQADDVADRSPSAASQRSHSQDSRTPTRSSRGSKSPRSSRYSTPVQDSQGPPDQEPPEVEAVPSGDHSPSSRPESRSPSNKSNRSTPVRPGSNENSEATNNDSRARTESVHSSPVSSRSTTAEPSAQPFEEEEIAEEEL